MPRDELFDLAVNRALSYALKLRILPTTDAQVVYRGLEVWYLKTRFAYRVPLVSLCEVLVSYPGEGFFWSGGAEGAWIAGQNPRP